MIDDGCFCRSLLLFEHLLEGADWVMRDTIKVGIAGFLGRGGNLAAAVEGHPHARVQAVCDIDERRLVPAAASIGAEPYMDYDRMLSEAELDAVILGTPMQLHASQAVQALDRNIHVLSEVVAAVSVEECRELVAAQERSSATYMLSENYCYTKANMLIEALVAQDLFGTVYYAEGEYLHDLKDLNEITKWRRRWQTGVDGITYGTHSLGPILRWMPGDQVVSVCCRGSGHHYRDPRGDLYENQDTCVMLAKSRRGALIKIRVDMVSTRPHVMHNFQLQGTEGAYESARVDSEVNRVWLSALDDGNREWMDLRELEGRFLPDVWRQASSEAVKFGHGGGDHFVLEDFIAVVRGERQCRIDIHTAMDMTLPGLISQESIARDGMWLEVPDSRTWHTE
ncbi:MAG: Gfo/Idh/MocA family oxidoreductase [Caldilineaceae bacterium SB0666_bin_21]|nr:Gfo/Idh/MocA family oxidoreductase [Caldilineaceae bacterium SB0666_bin_21]